MGFTKKALLVFVVLENIGAKELERDRAVELRILGLIDDTHAALAELGGDLVVRDGLPNQDGDIVALLGLLLRTIVPTTNPILSAWDVRRRSALGLESLDASQDAFGQPVGVTQGALIGRQGGGAHRRVGDQVAAHEQILIHVEE